MSYTDDYGFEWHAPRQDPNKTTRFITFEIEAEKDEALSAEAGRPVHKDVHYVHIRNLGSRDEFINAAEIYIMQNPHDREVKELYEEWKQRGDGKNVIKGTALKQCPFLTRSDIADFNALNIYSVEQLVSLPDSAKHRFHNINHLIAKAQAFLDLANDTALATKQAEVINAQNDKIAHLEQIIKDMGDRLDAMKAKK